MFDWSFGKYGWVLRLFLSTSCSSGGLDYAHNHLNLTIFMKSLMYSPVLVTLLAAALIWQMIRKVSFVLSLLACK
jgi:hypothetical protein